MFEKLNVAQLEQESLNWLFQNVFTVDAVFQAGILILSFSMASLVYRTVKGPLTEKLNSLRIPYRLTETLRRLSRMSFHATALLLIVLGAKIAGPEGLGLNVNFCMGVAKLLTAWILIRFLVQIIENRFARNTFAFIIWTIAALSIFGIFDETTAALDALGMDIGKFRLSALTVIKGVMAIFVLLYGALFFSTFIERKIERAASLTPSSRVLLSKTIRVLLITIALIVGVTTAGIDLSLLAVFSGAVGLGVGFGLQRVISNLFSGMMLLMDQSIKPGDIIEMLAPDGKMSTYGWVQHMGSRYTEIVTRDNKSFLVPNEQFITQQVVNWSHGDTLVRLEVRFRAHFDSNPHQIREICVLAATKPERVVQVPAPMCHLEEFGDSSLNFVLRFWIKDAEKGVVNIRGEVLLAIWDAFQEHGIKIPYPHREIFIREKD